MIKKNALKSYLQILLFTILITGICLFIMEGRLTGIDDAFIYRAYMRNLANGHGFVYNIGGERVEGFTSLLWTLIGSLFYIISERPVVLMLVFNLLLVSYYICRVCLFINRYFQATHFFSLRVVLFLGLLIAIPGYFEWNILSLMDTGLWSGLLILISLNILEFDIANSKKRQNLIFCLLLILLVFTRPESILWGIFFIAVRFYQWLFLTKNIKQAFWRTTAIFFSFGAAQSALILWRLHYFGYPFPNTYYAKVSADRFANLQAGMRYLLDFFHAYPFEIIICLIAISWATHYWKMLKKENLNIIDSIHEAFLPLFLSGTILMTFFIPLISGGDFFVFFRFIQPSAVFLYLMFVYSINYFHFPLNKSWLSLILLFVLFSSIDNIFHTLRTRQSPITYGCNLALSDMERSKKLNEFFNILPHLPSQGVYTAGGSAFAYKGITIDLLGLNNTQMAHADKIKDKSMLKNHASFNKDIFYKQKPDIVWITSGFVNPNDHFDITKLDKLACWVLKNINEEKKFKDEYTNCLIIKKGEPAALHIVANNEFLNSLDTNYFKVIK
ncbi:MAG: hypothetical protein JST58_10810 [Bacteroidetes bacterium]|nr:hypothetical protein [Bacteroidota bacterium]